MNTQVSKGIVTEPPVWFEEGEEAEVRKMFEVTAA